MKLTFDPETLTPIFDGAKESTESLDLAQRGIMSGFGGMKFGNIPIGDALLGGASATLVTEVISGFVGTGITGALVKLVAGNMLAGMFSGVMGRGATDSARLFITYDAIRDIVPIDTWTSQILGGVTGAVGGGNANGNGNSVAAAQNLNTGNGSVIAIDHWLNSAA